MTREEQIKQQADKYIGHSEDLGEDINTTIERIAFIEGVKWADANPNKKLVYTKKELLDMGFGFDLNGNIIDKGMTTYQIDNEPCHLTYQWDTLFGITIVYPEEISSKEAIEFLSKYF